jgi:GTP cyclohydrolase II
LRVKAEQKGLISVCLAATLNNEDKMKDLTVSRYAETNLPTNHGMLRMLVYHNNRNQQEDIAMISGDVEGRSDVAVRIHSECMTSEVFGSLKCDCKDQLNYALDTISEEGFGILLYLRQEGRGIGLGNKIRAYALQEMGLDTVDANRHLGFDDDLRDYRVAAKMLKDLNVKSVRLMTNNPNKIIGLRDNGVAVLERKPIQMQATVYSEDYMRTKAERSGHLIDVEKICVPQLETA